MNKLITAAMATTLLAAPAMAADAPGYFKVPGTDTTMKIYGHALFDASYDMKQGLGGVSSNDVSAAVADGFAPKNQFGTEVRGRVGITTTTPSAMGDVTTKFEGQASGTNGSSFNMRHAYGQVGGLLIGLTDSLFCDTDAPYTTIDEGSMLADYVGRVNQVRYSFNLSKEATLAFSLEQPREGKGDTSAMSMVAGTWVIPAPPAVPYYNATLDAWGKKIKKDLWQKDNKMPSIVGAFSYNDGWGHLHAAVAVSRYATFLSKDDAGTMLLHPFLMDVKEYKASKTAFSWSVGGHVNLGDNDNIGLNIVGGNSSFYTPGAGYLIPDNDGVKYALRNTLGGWINWGHTWNEKVSSNIVIDYMTWKDNDDLDGHTIDKFSGEFDKRFDVYVNTFVKIAPNAKIGVEYVYGQIQTKGAKGVEDVDGNYSDKLKESRLNFNCKWTFF